MMKRRSTTNPTTNVPIKRPAKEVPFKPEPNPEWTRSFNAGREAFANKQFKEASTFFTRALEFDYNRSEVLDCRGVTFAALKDHDLAAADFMTLIKKSPNRSRGYLRLGKQLVERNMLDQAVKVYERARDKVDHSDVHYETVIRALNSTRIVRDDKKNGRDFIKVLPYELVCQIFSYLSFAQRAQCMCVCKTWRGFGLNWSGMWSDMEFGRRTVPSATLTRYFSYATGRHIRKLSITDKKSKIEKVLKLLVHQDAQYIESLSFIQSEIPGIHFLRMLRLVGKNLTHLRLDSSQMHIEDVFNTTLSTCRNLTHLSYFGYDENVSGEMPIFVTPASLSPLRHLQLSCTRPGDGTGAHLDSILRLFSNLRVFILHGSEDNINRILSISHTTCPHLNVFRFKRPWDRRLLGWEDIDQRTGMTEISIIGAHELESEYIVPLFQTHKNTLETLDISRCGNGTGRMVPMMISPALPQLRKLNLTCFTGLKESDLVDLVQKSVFLEELVLAMVFTVSDLVLECMARHPVLKSIDISSCINVTGFGIRQLVDTKGNMLNRLRITDCRKVSPDAIEYASKMVRQNVLEYR
ncbi:hypothetical protein CLU79DRAFT_817648 [Phycomyces nitens]|nr:hypothetical protein CLU79DRAFT_817648 [Phycomyces nitens]